MLSVCQNQPLGPKEAGLFKQLIKHYETKQTKKGLKIADQILKKHPDHGETLAMKGLLTANLGPEKREEAYEQVRQGVKSDLKSHVCWHAYGLLYRGDRDYKEAIKCYMNALRLEKDNMLIMRDLSVLQIQTRDLQGFVETRQRILDLKPSNRQNWISYALAHHANRSFEVAVQVLDAYRKTLSDEIPPSEAYEHSELILYKVMVLEEGGRLEDALQVLDSEKSQIRDIRGMKEMRASILMQAGRMQEAEQQYRELLQDNPDHYRYHEGLQATMGLRPEVQAASNATADVIAATALTDDQRAQMTTLYAELATTYPCSSSCRRIPLDFLQGDAFLAAADAYVRKYLLKGVPSLFMDLRPLYRDASKARALQSLFTSFREHLDRQQALPPLRPQPTGSPLPPETPVKQESPEQVHVWVLVYLAQHYDHLGQTTKGLELLDIAIQKAPTLIELLTTRTKLLKHAGDHEGAAHAAETARRLDLSDRYLNSIAVKALFGAGKPDAAAKTAALFTKDGDQLSALHDMQHMWFECAAGAVHLKRKEWGKALKQFTTVISHFKEIEEDQFDFHGYCMRKTTLRAYVETLRMEDRLFGHPFYSKAAQGAAKAYLALHDAPSTAYADANEEALMAGMSSEDRKKYKLKKKKEEKQKSKEGEEEKAAAAAAAASKDQTSKPGGKKGDKKEADPDPEGIKLAAVPEPLEEASKLVASLKQHAAGALQTQLLALQVYLRKSKMLLALSAAQRAAAIAGAQHPQVHLAIIQFCSRAQSSPPKDAPSPHPEVASLIKSGQEVLLGRKHATSVKAYNDEWLAANCQDSNSRSDVLPARLAGAEALLVLAKAGQMAMPEAKAQAAKLLTSASPLTGAGSKRQHEQCVAIMQLLEEGVGDAATAKKWRDECTQAFPFSRIFGGSRRVNLENDYNFDTMTEAFGYLSFQ